MTEKKMTRVEALNIALDVLVEHEGECEATEVIRKHIAQLSKPRKKADGPSKTRRENEQLLIAMIEAIEAKGEPVTSKWVTEHVRGLLTPQKVTAVAKIGIDDGRLVRIKEGKAVYYALPE